MDTQRFHRLIHRFREDEKAFEEIYVFYFPRIKIYIDRKYTDYKIGEDIAQEFFIKLFRINIPEKIQHPTLWVFNACDNLAKSYLSLQKNRIINILDENSLISADIDSELNHTFNGGISKENMQILKNLDDLTIEIFVMYYWEGYNYREIASKLGISHEQVRQRASRGLKKLKKCLR